MTGAEVAFAAVALVVIVALWSGLVIGATR